MFTITAYPKYNTTHHGLSEGLIIPNVPHLLMFLEEVIPAPRSWRARYASNIRLPVICEIRKTLTYQRPGGTESKVAWNFFHVRS